MRVLFEKNGYAHIVEPVCVKECYYETKDGIAFKATNTDITEIQKESHDFNRWSIKEEDNNVWFFAEMEPHFAEEILISSFSTGLMDLRNYSVIQI